MSIFGKTVTILKQQKAQHKDGLKIDIPYLGLSTADERNLAFHVGNLLRVDLRSNLRKGIDATGKRHSISQATIEKRIWERSPGASESKSFSERFPGRNKLSRGESFQSNRYFWDGGDLINKMRVKRAGPVGAMLHAIEHRQLATKGLDADGAPPIGAKKEPLDQGIKDYLEGCLQTHERAKARVTAFRKMYQEG